MWSAIARQQFAQIARQPHGGVLTFSLLAALWSTSSGMTAIVDSLNQAYRITRAPVLVARAPDGGGAHRRAEVVTLIAFALVMAGTTAASYAAELAGARTAVPLGLERAAVAAGVHAGRRGDRLHLPLRA